MNFRTVQLAAGLLRFNIHKLKGGIQLMTKKRNVILGALMVFGLTMVVPTEGQSAWLNKGANNKVCNIDKSKRDKCNGDMLNCDFDMNFKGKITGLIFEDVNGNGMFDKCSDKMLKDVKVNVTDASGAVVSGFTNSRGKFKIRKLAPGEAVIDIDDTTLPVGASIVVGMDMKHVEVKPRGVTWTGFYGYSLCEPTGNVIGKIFVDINENGQMDMYEFGTSGISVTLVDVNGDTHTVMTDAKGNYTFSNIVAGAATVTVDMGSLPDNASLTVGDNPSEINVEANMDNNAGIDGYVICLQTTGSVTGFVFEDRDSNGQFDESYDLPIVDLTVTIKASNGEEYNVTTDDTGHYTADEIPSGDATVTVDDANITAAYPDAVQTAGDNPTSIEVKADETVDAGADSFNFMDGGLISGKLYKDENGDGVYTEGTDTPMENIEITMENVKNSRSDVVVTITATTNASGVWYAYMKKPQDTNMKATVNESDIEDNYGNLEISEGENPTRFTLDVGPMNNIGHIGYKESNNGKGEK
jgi:hypothetical protein